MHEPLRTVAVLIANPALSSILSMTLAGAPSLRVRPFETELALRTYLHLAPTDLLVVDLDHELAERLRSDPEISLRLQIIALASDLTPGIRAAALHAGIDELIMKPMSPRYLVERVLARLAKTRALDPRRGPIRHNWTAYGPNIVPLFRPAPDPR